MSVSVIVLPSSLIDAVMPALLKLICFANSEGSSPVLSTVIVLVPKFPVISNDHVPGLLF